MGIKFKDIFTDYKEDVDLKSLNGKKVGIDAYVMIYQMLARVRRAEEGGAEFSYQGNVTSHLIGIFQRCLYLLENGMKVCAIMDGRLSAARPGWARAACCMNSRAGSIC